MLYISNIYADAHIAKSKVTVVPQIYSPWYSDSYCSAYCIFFIFLTKILFSFRKQTYRGDAAIEQSLTV
jgi:hypothetical protein